MLTESISDTFIPWRSKAFSLKSSISPGCTKYLISLAVKKAGRKSSINNSCFFHTEFIVYSKYCFIDVALSQYYGC